MKREIQPVGVREGQIFLDPLHTDRRYEVTGVTYSEERGTWVVSYLWIQGDVWMPVEMPVAAFLREFRGTS